MANMQNLPEIQAGSIVRVATVADLPSTNVTSGAVRFVDDPGEVYRWDGSAWAAMTAGSMTGPGTATDNAIPRFDGTSGSVLDESVVTISDLGAIAGAKSLTLSDLTASTAIVSSGAKALVSSATTATEIGYVSGVTSSIQTQLDSKEPNINLTASRAVVSDGSGDLAVATTTATEIGYVAGVTSAIQTQIDGKQPLDVDLTALAALASAGVVARTGAGTVAARTITGTASEITVSDGDGVSGNPTLSLATGINPTKLADGSVTATEFQYLGGVTSDIQTQINDLQTDVDGKQPLDADLTAVAGLSSTGLIARTGSGAAAVRTITGTANEITVSDGNGVSGNPTLSLATGIDAAKIANGTVSSTEFQRLNGVSSDIQTQLDAKSGLPTSMVRSTTSLGFGSSGSYNCLRRFNAALSTTTGTAITHTDSSTDGSRWTINEAGVYSMSLTDSFTAAIKIGISLNAAASGATGIYSLTAAERLALTTCVANEYCNVAVTARLAAGDVICVHGEGGTGANTGAACFTITQNAKL
jgi:hypothetical protein